ncbi:ABC transporter ATP-binding protein [Corynebacterium lubricantis]|uniref:ABC transporter ATP-binding protein n=1 Tax=Corynebacterium lubricantis TaxID=541095 RepID=UPI00037CD5A6|nr:ABC transporter ATP-binding protein [Corynebacterium lubricantis]
MSTFIIEARDIRKSFSSDGEPNVVLNNFSLTIALGEFVAIMGPSGSGKSTLLFALSGIDTIDSGEVLFDDKNLATASENELADLRREQMGFVFQQPTMLKNLNILDNIILPSMNTRRSDRDLIVEEARSIMADLSISHLEDREITQTSGGELQRAAIARALMGSPKVIFGDEPTGALNTKTADEIMEAFEQINQSGTTVVLVTHDARVASRAGRVVFMRDGKIAEDVLLSEGLSLDERRDAVARQMNGLGI